MTTGTANMPSFDATYDVIVVGYGFAGARSALPPPTPVPKSYWLRKSRHRADFDLLGRLDAGHAQS